MAGLTTGDEPSTVRSAPVWVVVATGILALIGLGISIYLTITHFEPQALACNTGFFNCVKVTTSAQSAIVGIPVAVLGLGYFLVVVPLVSPWAWRSNDRRLHIARLVVACMGMAFVLWLITAELLIIDGFCEWCTGVHIVTFPLFVLTVTTVPNMLSGDRES